MSWKTILLCVVAMFLLSCAGYSRWQKRELRTQFVRCVEYVRDHRTGLCFAYNWCGGGISNVDSKHCR